MKKVVVGMSGGVDSSVAAHLLLEQGYDVTGLFMINWKDRVGTLQSNCSWEDDLMFAELVAKQFGIPLEVVDLSEQYKTRVADYLFNEYAKGRTPNPDILCNREIKFDAFVEAAMKLNADYIATGHYARVAEVNVNNNIEYALLAGKDKNKDQSYFLCGLNQKQLSKTLFPLGELIKPEVRTIAKNLKLASSDKKDSQGICFIGKVDLPEFLSQRLEAIEGNIVEIFIPDNFNFNTLNDFPTEEELEKSSMSYDFSKFPNKIIGKHIGSQFYTVGQRRGLNIGGTSEPMYVLGLDTVSNIVYTGKGKKHPLLSRIALKIHNDEVNWIRTSNKLLPEQSARYKVRIRYRQPLIDARLFVKDKATYLVFDEPLSSITSGQFAAWYSGDELVGSGVIA